MQCNNGPSVLTVKLSRKTKQWSKKYETFQFFTQESPEKGSFGIIKVALKKESLYFFLKICHHIKFRKNLMNWLDEIFVLLNFWVQKCPIWDKVFRIGLSEICVRQSLKNLKWWSFMTEAAIIQKPVHWFAALQINGLVSIW